MRSLLDKWDPKITVIQEAKDLNTLSLDELMGSGIRRDSLRSLRLGVRLGWISNYFLRVLFTIYRNVEKISFFCDNVDGDFGRTDITDEQVLVSNHDFTSSSILRKLQDSNEKMTVIDLSAYNCLHSVPGEPIHYTITNYTFSKYVHHVPNVT